MHEIEGGVVQPSALRTAVLSLAIPAVHLLGYFDSSADAD